MEQMGATPHCKICGWAGMDDKDIREHVAATLDAEHMDMADKLVAWYRDSQARETLQVRAITRSV